MTPDDRAAEECNSHIQIAAQFKGKITDKRRQIIRENLDRLEWFGLAIQQENTWHYAAPNPIA